MTSDGISEEDWEKVRDLAALVANAAFHERDQDRKSSNRKLHAFLDALIMKYGHKPSLLATLADFSDDPDEQITLNLKAIKAAEDISDYRNMVLSALSLAEIYTEAKSDRAAAQKWLDYAKEHPMTIQNLCEENHMREIETNMQNI